MKTQNLIKQTLSQPESVVVVQQILEDNANALRSAIAERVRKHFSFFNALGRQQKAGCPTLRYQEIELPPPSDHEDKPPLTLSVVHIRERRNLRVKYR